MQVDQSAAVPLSARQCRKMSEISAGYLSGEQYKFGFEHFHVAVQFMHIKLFSLKSQIEIVQMPKCVDTKCEVSQTVCLVIQGSRQFYLPY